MNAEDSSCALHFSLNCSQRLLSSVHLNAESTVHMSLDAHETLFVCVVILLLCNMDVLCIYINPSA